MKLVSMLLLACLITASANNEIAPDNETKAVDHGLVAWLNSLEGGYFNPKQEIRRENPEDPKSIVGIFAKERIEEGELLNQVPWLGIINQDAFEFVQTGDLQCGIVKSTAHEMKLGEKSQFAPYVSYLSKQREGQLPSAWSEAGQDLLLDLVWVDGEEKPRLPPHWPVSWLEEDWYDDCEGDPDDSFTSHVAMLVVQRSDDSIMVPIYDFYNHRNGQWYNTRLTINKGVSHVVQAGRTIEAGEQIYNSYNLCDECGGRKSNYGTPGKCKSLTCLIRRFIYPFIHSDSTLLSLFPEIVRDYGFVENFPQRWIFWIGDVMLKFDLDEDDNGEIQIIWWDNKFKPKQDNKQRIQVAYRTEYTRLVEFRNGLMNRRDVLENEWLVVWEFCQAMTNAIAYAINDMKDAADEKVTILIDAADDVCLLNSNDGKPCDDQGEE